jgi:hypothetical protein
VEVDNDIAVVVLGKRAQEMRAIAHECHKMHDFPYFKCIE